MTTATPSITDALAATVASSAPAKTARTTRARRPRADTTPRCSRCGDDFSIRWRRRDWCINCDRTELFGEIEKVGAA